MFIIIKEKMWRTFFSLITNIYDQTDLYFTQTGVLSGDVH